MKLPNILLFNMSAGHNPADLSAGSNTWQIKNYEEIADTVYALFLGKESEKKVVKNGRTIILCVGSGKSRTDFFKAPWIIYRLVKQKKIKIVITYEQVFLGWFVLFVRLLRKRRVVLMPLTLPAMMYKITNRSLSIFIPIWFEKILRRISSFFVRYVITSQMLGEYKKWLSEDWVFRKKILLLNKVVEEIPSPHFFNAIEKQKKKHVEKDDSFQLLCVSRLRKEKLIVDVLKCLAELIKTHEKFLLHIIGEGEDFEYFKEVSRELNIENCVVFHGYMPLDNIIPFYAKCDVYISAFTGSALREVSLFGMPVVAYEMDWVKGTFTNGVNYLGVEPFNYQMLAEGIMKIKNDPKLAESLRINIHKLGIENWSVVGLSESYKNIMI
jgi:glycosyltransferase involved in cell wall biosynthesis